MKALIVLVLPVLAFGAGTSMAGRASMAGRPMGAIYSPATRPMGAIYAPPPSTRPLGGVTYPRRRNNRSNTPGYVGPVYYVPNAFDSYPDYSSYAPPPPPPPAPPVIVNQYFGTPGSSVPGEYNTADLGYPSPPTPTVVSPGDPLAPPQNYYLIRYKDRNTFSALTYWLEGDTLHYVTTDNRHNQASLELIDLDQTYKLNADQSVPFSIPGR